MDEPNLSYEEAMQGLVDLFTEGPVPTKPPYRRYVLEFIDGKPIFRRDADEFEMAFDEAIKEIFELDSDGDKIVPQKLAKQFSDRSRRDEPS